MFSSRTDKKELLDEEFIAPAELRRNLAELHYINKWLGGYSASLNAFRYLLKSDRQPHVVVDLGSGGGGTLSQLKKWTLRKRLQWKLHGIDNREECVKYASSVAGDWVTFVCDDYRNVLRHIPDATILHASLFCHHLSNDEITDLIRFASNNHLILVINDLERHPVAYLAIKLLTRLFSQSRLVRNDAPLSVLRGFRRQEWISMLRDADAGRYVIRKRWAFRHQVIIFP